MKTYEIKAVRSGKWWALSVPEIKGVYSQARSLSEARSMAREAIALMLDIPEDSFDVELTIEPWADEIRELNAVRAEQQELEERLDALRLELLEQFKAGGVSTRDAGEALGLSHQRISQLKAAHG